jgi:hypothetical protein
MRVDVYRKSTGVLDLGKSERKERRWYGSRNVAAGMSLHVWLCFVPEAQNQAPTRVNQEWGLLRPPEGGVGAEDVPDFLGSRKVG